MMAAYDAWTTGWMDLCGGLRMPSASATWAPSSSRSMERSTTSSRRSPPDEPLHRRTDADDGKKRILPHWTLATHMFSHATHYRGQLTTLMKQLGIDPGVTDFPWLSALYDGAMLNATQM
jgi:uncharacterized damage-inducible protein DinB